MLLLCLSLLLFCLCPSAEHTAILREAGENVTLECSCAGSPNIRDTGMYLYHILKEKEEVLYYHLSPEPEKSSPRKRYSERIQAERYMMDHIIITIGNLSVEDSGLYHCAYNQGFDSKDIYNPYILVVEVPSPMPSRVIDMAADGQCPPLMLITIATCAVSVLVTIFIGVMISMMVKQCAKDRRTTNTSQLSNENVYEFMGKTNLHPLKAQEQFSPSPNQMLLAC